MPTAVEEMIRWTTPVKEFMRTAADDTDVRGVPIAKGESVYLAYVSGNRDEEVFDDPFRFDVGREPNKHLAFGYGVHFCLGAALARMEMNSLFSELIPRLDSIELAGEPELSATTFVGGLKHLPIRYSLKWSDGGDPHGAVVELRQSTEPAQRQRTDQQGQRRRTGQARHDQTPTSAFSSSRCSSCSSSWATAPCRLRSPWRRSRYPY